jgi:hypothetical protein
MKGYRTELSLRFAALAAFTAMVVGLAGASPPAMDDLQWMTVAHNNHYLPGTAKRFNSYNPPSVNAGGLVVFRARSRGPQPMSGIYLRDMSRPGAVVVERWADRDTIVPQPNNTLYGPDRLPATFNEFPSFPRIDMDSDTVASRGNHQPAWTYTELDENGEPQETRVGTNGVYTNPGGILLTGASLVGAVDGFGRFRVPGVEPVTRFDVFPGAPSITDGSVIVFKGNYTTPGGGRTGVYYRDVLAHSGLSAVEPIADTETVIPNLPDDTADVTFGSTAPPSAARGRMVFVGYDNEADPSYGGIYLAPLTPSPDLTTLLGLEETVPVRGVNEIFRRIGEGLSFDGRFVAFWASWGEAERTLRLYCPETGNKDRRDYCNNVGGSGDPNSVFDEQTGRWYQEKAVPVNQGIFVHDTRSARTRLVVRTGAGLDDMLYWNYSGAPPGAGHGEGEPPRWRSTAFLAVSGRNDGSYWAAFLARTGNLNAQNVYDDPVDGLYVRKGPGNADVATLLRTGMDGTILDADALDPEGNVLPITSLGLERDGFRDGWLAITAGMGVEESEEAGWAGVYAARIGTPRGR